MCSQELLGKSKGHVGCGKLRWSDEACVVLREVRGWLPDKREWRCVDWWDSVQSKQGTMRGKSNPLTNDGPGCRGVRVQPQLNSSRWAAICGMGYETREAVLISFHFAT